MVDGGDQPPAGFDGLIILPQHKKFVPDQNRLGRQVLAEGARAAEHAGQVGEVGVAGAEIAAAE